MGEATFTFRVDESLKADFAQAAKEADRTAAQLLRDFMREYIRRQQDEADYDAWFISEVEKGIAEADAGLLVSHEEVEARAAAWRAAVLAKLGETEA